MEQTLTTKLQDATIELSMGLYTVRFHEEAGLDVNQMKRVEAARRELLSDDRGPVLVLIPSNAALVEQEALAWLGSEEAMQNVSARAVVVPSSITVLRDRIRWALFRPSVPFRVFRNAQIAKGWALDQWYDKQIGMEIDSFEKDGII